jgi:hypothetical protein
MVDQVASQVPGQPVAGQPGGDNPISDQGHDNPEGEKKGSKLMWWIIGGVVIAVVLIGTYVLLK